MTNPSCREIIETIAHLCRSKGIRIVAEFVETEEQRRLLQQLGCSEFQGYLFSKPLPPDACLEFIRTCNRLPARHESHCPAEAASVTELPPFCAVD